MKTIIPSRNRQRGAISVMTAAILAVALGCLVLVVDSGRLYMEKRALQRAADTSAIEAVARGGNCATQGQTAYQYAQNNIDERTSLVLDDLTVKCVDLISRDENGVTIREVGGENQESNIVQVVLRKSTKASLVTCLFEDCNLTLQATAVAGRGENPIAVFTVGSKLISLRPNESALGPLLRGIGISLDDASVLGYNGLVDAKITPAGLLEALGVPVSADLTLGGLESLLDARQLKVGDILDAAVKVAGQEELLGTNLSLLSAIKAKLKVDDLDLNVPLLRDEDGNPGIFALVSSTENSSINSALGVNVGVLDIITGAIGIATKNHAIETGLNLNLLGLASVELKLGLVEPPSIGIGGVGTKAYTAQLRTFLHVSTTNGILGGLLNRLLSIKIDLPIVIDLVSGQGEILELCTPELYSDDKDHVDIEVTGNVAQICIGEFLDDASIFSKKNACDDSALYKANKEFINVLNLVRLRNQLINLNALPIAPESAILAENEVGTVGNQVLLGDTVSNLVDTLVSLLLNQNVGSNPKSEVSSELAEKLWGESSVRCTDVSVSCHNKRINYIKEQMELDSYSTGLLQGLLDFLGNLLGGILGGNGCTSTGLVGGLLGGKVSASQCVAFLEGELNKNLSGESNGVGNALSFLLGLVAEALKPILNAVGVLLSSLLDTLLGLRLGIVDVHLQDLSCGEPRLLL